MKLGMFMMPLHPPGRNATETLAEDREAFLLADRLGLRGGLRRRARHRPGGERHVLPDVPGERSRTRRRTSCWARGTINMPNSHPAAIAAQVAMLDHILKGRFIMGISPGGLMSDAEVFGNYQKNRNAMFLESINMVLEDLGERRAVRPAGRVLQGLDASRRRSPRSARARSSSPTSSRIRRIVGHRRRAVLAGRGEMAKRGWTPISANFLLPEWVATHWPQVRRGTRGGRRQGGPGRVARGQVDLRRRRREDGAALRQGPEGPVPLLLQAARAQAGGRAAAPTCSSWTRRARHARSRRST